MTVVINGTTGITTPDITSDGGFTADGVSFASGAPANTLVTTAGGNVGIGTSSPSNKFQVMTTGAGTPYVAFTGNSDDPTIEFQRWTGSGSNYVSARIKGGVDGSGGISFSTGAAAAIGTQTYTERARIDSSGNLLVGQTSGNSRLTVQGTSGSASCDVGVGANGNNAFSFRNASNSYVGSITVNASTTAFNTSSDYRLKENVQPMTGALSVVSQLKPCTYTWKLDGSDGQGFIAHELQAVVPDAVVGEKDAVDADGNPVYQGIDTSFLVATLTAAIQELNAKVDAQAAEIAALKGQA